MSKKIDVVAMKQHGNRFKSNESYLNELINKKYTVVPLEDYKGATEKILHQCLLCGFKYYASPHNILRGKEKCKNCKKNYIHQKYVNTVAVCNPNIEILSFYNGDPGCLMDVCCKLCGHAWTTSASTLKKHRECQNCGKITNSISEEEFLQTLYSKNKNIKIISKFKRVDGTHICKCLLCEYTWSFKGRNFRRLKLLCPKCSQKTTSIGERKIVEILEKYNIEHELQKMYPGLVGTKGGLLSYDFYLPQYNLLIEFQGVQHERFTEGLQIKEEEFINQLEHDRRKRDYAKKHNIDLLEIWYFEYENIEQIIVENLKLISVETAGCA